MTRNNNLGHLREEEAETRKSKRKTDDCARKDGARKEQGGG